MKPKLKKMKCKKSLTRFPEYRDKNKSYFAQRLSASDVLFIDRDQDCLASFESLTFISVMFYQENCLLKSLMSQML